MIFILLFFLLADISYANENGIMFAPKCNKVDGVYKNLHGDFAKVLPITYKEGDNIFPDYKVNFYIINSANQHIKLNGFVFEMNMSGGNDRRYDKQKANNNCEQNVYFYQHKGATFAFFGEGEDMIGNQTSTPWLQIKCETGGDFPRNSFRTKEEIIW